MAGPRAGMDVAESATTCFIDDKLRRMIAATPQGLQIKTAEEEDGAAVPFFSEFDSARNRSRRLHWRRSSRGGGGPSLR